MSAKVKASELALADVVKVFDDAYGYATVTQVTEDEVTLFRPYVHTSDFSYTGGVIPYVGVETTKVWRKGSTEFELLKKGAVK
jgi:hypothetical protein